MTMDPNSFLMGTGGKSASFKAHGDTVWGFIQDMAIRQQTDFKSGKPLFWDDGNPRNQLVVTLQTEEQEDNEDDGLRNVYVRGELQKAVANAVRKAGARGLAEGGKLLVRYTGDAPAKVKGENGAKLYFVKYEQPQYALASGDPNEPPPIDADDLPF